MKAISDWTLDLCHRAVVWRNFLAYEAHSPYQIQHHQDYTETSLHACAEKSATTNCRSEKTIVQLLQLLARRTLFSRTVRAMRRLPDRANGGRLITPQRMEVVKTNPKFKYTIFITGIFTEWTLMFGWDHDKRTTVVDGNPQKRIGSTSISEYV